MATADVSFGNVQIMFTEMNEVSLAVNKTIQADNPHIPHIDAKPVLPLQSPA